MGKKFHQKNIHSRTLDAKLLCQSRTLQTGHITFEFGRTLHWSNVSECGLVTLTGPSAKLGCTKKNAAGARQQGHFGFDCDSNLVAHSSHINACSQGKQVFLVLSKQIQHCESEQVASDIFRRK
jgi:hypothetical protein